MSDSSSAVTIAISRTQVCTAIKTGAVILTLLGGIVSAPFLLAFAPSLGFLMVAALLFAVSAIARDEARVALRSLAGSFSFAATFYVVAFLMTGQQGASEILAAFVSFAASFLFFFICAMSGMEIYDDNPSMFVDMIRDFSNGASMFGRIVLSVPGKAARAPAELARLFWKLVRLIYTRLSPGCERDVAGTAGNSSNDA